MSAVQSQKKQPELSWKLHTDGAIRPELGLSGLAAIARDGQGRILYWWCRRAGALTCNEAEYAAAIFALEQVLRLPPGQRPQEVTVCSDSRVLVDQMTGRAEAHAPALRQARDHLHTLARRFRKVTFQHIPRQHNRLADALAFEALGEIPAQPPARELSGLHPETCNEFLKTWRLP